MKIVAEKMVGVAVVLALGTAHAMAQTPTPTPPATPAKVHETLPVPEVSPDPLPAAENAAIYYWRAWSFQPEKLMADVDVEFNGRDKGWKPSEALAKKLEDSQGFILNVLAASEFPRCDFQLEYSLGRELSLPHLDRARATARVLVSDIRRLHAAGKVDEAVRRTASLFAMARHFREDRLTHSAATAQGFARMAADEVARFAEARALTDEHRRRLREATGFLAESDPFYFAGAIRREGAVSFGYLGRFQGAEAGNRLMSALALGGEPEDAVHEIQAMDQAKVDAARKRVLSYFHEAAAAWGGADAVERLRALEQKILDGSFGPVALLVCPGMSPAKVGSEEQLRVIREAVALLEAPADATGRPTAPASTPQEPATVGPPR